MRTAARVARIGNGMIDLLAALLVLTMFLYGSYSLWDNWRISNQAFVTDDLLQYKPTPENTESLEELVAINPDVIGWITIEDTHIDYPLVQGETDMEYVNKDVHGDFALSGSIFLSSLNDKFFKNPYSLTYGHHMDNGAMYGDVIEFINEDYFSPRTKGTLYLLDRSIEITLFACIKTEASDSIVFNPTRQEKDNAELLEYLEKNAEHFRDIGVTKDDRIIGLSTCSEAVTNGRVIIYGKLGKETIMSNGGGTDEHE